MSRLGKMPISIPKGVEVKRAGEGQVRIQGPKGILHLDMPQAVHMSIESGVVILERKEEGTCDVTKAEHGLYRSLLKNCIVGVTEGYRVELEMVGVGYRASIQGTKLDIQVGFSHPTILEVPKGLQVSVLDKGVIIVVEGIDKRLVGQFAAEVRSQRPPEPYKGKGIRYRNEYVRKKEGKAAKGK
jgi:large subunit ribosomal protein L6